VCTDYQPSPGLKNPHLQSIAPSVFRNLSHRFERKRLELADGDFLLLDWWTQSSDRLVILTHGLEGNSRRSYMIGMARWFIRHGWDVLSWNFRGCGGEMNRLPRFYHSGEIGDLSTVIEHALSTKDYQQLSLIGFSMGGNQTLVYLGRDDIEKPDVLKSAVAISVPCDLAGCADVMADRKNSFYMQRFVNELGEKVKQKAQLFPELISAADYHQVNSFHQFDDRYTAPLHGFRDAQDYWQQCSSQRFLKDIQTPTLLINALDDPFLSESCFPYELASQHRHLSLSTPKYGGHVGFIRYRMWAPLWSEQQALKFCQHHS
jgi:predicted alpha/beta-fold hydrolase